MMGSYPRDDEYGGRKNAFGDRIPKARPRDTISILPTFNQELPVDHLFDRRLR